MPSVKHFVREAIKSNHSRYAVDNGEINLINDYFISEGWTPIIIEQHKAIAGVIRQRNEFLRDDSNRAYDLRTKRGAYEHKGQTSIYDFLDEESYIQVPKIVRYFVSNEERLNYSNSRIKKSVRGSDSECIIATKVLYPLFKANPLLKQKRVKRVNSGDTRKELPQRYLQGVLEGSLETSYEVGYKS